MENVVGGIVFFVLTVASGGVAYIVYDSYVLAKRAVAALERIADAQKSD